jgi:DNA-binding response OmpR family regulator
MPNMNGYDFYKTIKQIKSTSTIPLVFFSARTERYQSWMQLGADDYYHKTFSLYELLKLSTHLAKYTLEQINNEKFALISNARYLYLSKGKLLFYNTH